MAHFREFFDTPYIGVWDLGGRDRVATITKVTSGAVGGQQGKKEAKKAIVHTREFDKPFCCNVTNATTIAGMYGADTREWVGKRITLFPTTTEFARKTVDCIRVRPTIPRGEPEHVGSRPVDREVREKQDRAAGRAESPGAPIAAATTPNELLAAIGACAAWITADHERIWPRVLKRCEELGLDEQSAVLAIAEAQKGAAQ